MMRDVGILVESQFTPNSVVRFSDLPVIVVWSRGGAEVGEVIAKCQGWRVRTSLITVPGPWVLSQNGKTRTCSGP